jgi:hypothetical protein
MKSLVDGRGVHSASRISRAGACANLVADSPFRAH